MVLDSDLKQLKASMNSFLPHKVTLRARHFLPNKLNLTIANVKQILQCVVRIIYYVTELKVPLYVVCSLYYALGQCR